MYLLASASLLTLLAYSIYKLAVRKRYVISFIRNRLGNKNKAIAEQLFSCVEKKLQSNLVVTKTTVDNCKKEWDLYYKVAL